MWRVISLLSVLAAMAVGQKATPGAPATSTTITSAVVVSDGLRCHDFCVEKLSTEEIARLADAQAKVDAAKNNFDAVMGEIENAHGKADGHHDRWADAMCWPYDSVEIWGTYALITYVSQSCVSY